MSLDIYFLGGEVKDYCPCCGAERTTEAEAHSQNITHNLAKMADEAGIYDVVWRPDENNITHAGQLIKPLENGILELRQNPDKYRPLSASNGWGTYDQFLPWLEKLLQAAKENPTAKVKVSR